MCYNKYMYKISNLKVPQNYKFSSLPKIIAKELDISEQFLSNFKLVRASLDARKKPQLFYVLTVAFSCTKNILGKKNIENYTEGLTDFTSINYTKTTKKNNIIVVGSGPAGLFATLTLLNAGQGVTLVERGQCVEERNKSINLLNTQGVLNPESNIQYGEGGAGTYSDGKLNSGVKSQYNELILNTFVKFGSPEDILYLAKPHIGSDYLQVVLKNFRKEIINKGGIILFDTRLDNVVLSGSKVTAVKVTTNNKTDILPCDAVVLATGHSAEDTYKNLYVSGLHVVQKPFSIGVRIEHLQRDINFSQYGSHDKALPSAEYKLSSYLKNGRSIYTFCMCPGGEVVCSSSDSGIVTNGMSNYKRDGVNANSAVLVGVTPNDFKSDNPLAGYEYKSVFEKKAFSVGGGKFVAPAVKLGDFLNKKVSTEFGKILPTYKRGTVFADMDSILPDYVTESLRLGLVDFDNKLKGFACPDAVLTGVETRTSAPIRILRDDNCESNIKGLYPAGEGAGYAGGIISSAKDGIVVALNMLKNLI